MKKAVLIFTIIFALCFQTVSASDIFMENNALTPPAVHNANAALLMDMNSGRLLYGKDINKRVYPASTTKIMTGILAIEMGNFGDVVSASAEAIAPITLEDSQIGILVGEKLTLEQLVNALLIPSANDAANVIAVHLAGSLDGFVELMNQKAKELGMKDTHFVNTCGMHHSDHYTTANDLSILAQYAMKNEAFRNIVKTAYYKIPPTNKYDSERYLTSTNLFLSSSYHRTPLCTGIKTGRTSKAGYCLVSSAEYEDIDLLSVILGCTNEDLEGKAYSYTETKEMFDFGFDNYKNRVVAAPDDIVYNAKVYEAKKRTQAALTVDTQINALVPAAGGESEEIEAVFNLPEKIPAPVAKGSVLGTVTYSYKGIVVGTANLVATNDVEISLILHILNIVIKIVISPFFFIPVIIILLLIISHNNEKKKIRKRRLQRQREREQNQSDYYSK